MQTEQICITTPYIKLGALLKLAGLVETGGVGGAVIADGLIKVNGEICTQRGKKIYPGHTVTVEDRIILEVVYADNPN
jgi:ribosome-associated protein